MKGFPCFYTKVTIFYWCIYSILVCLLGKQLAAIIDFFLIYPSSLFIGDAVNFIMCYFDRYEEFLGMRVFDLLYFILKNLHFLILAFFFWMIKTK
ncbi:hypothetical protein BKK49_09780 [Rodentibacter rarus]|nr:hypothetical protein BKK49_09780 [Rodentibacter rarus]